MSELALFKGKAKLPTLPANFVDPTTDALAGSTGSGRRISIKGKAFRQVVNGKEVSVSEENLLDVVIINAAPISRMFYSGEYQEGQSTAPTCWSSDTVSPDAGVPDDQKQSSRCADCPNNIKGSGKGDSRACRFSQRVAVVLDGEIEDEQVYQLQLPATSVFGDADGNKMGLQAYARFLKANNAHAIAVVTRMKFETAATQPKLLFSAVRPLEQEELDICLALRDHPDTIDAITLSVGETDGAKIGDTPEPAKKKAAAKPAPEPENDEQEEEEPAPVKKKAFGKKKEPVVLDEPDDEEEEEIPEPKKAVKKKAAPAPAEDDEDLDGLLDGWDD